MINNWSTRLSTTFHWTPITSSHLSTRVTSGLRCGLRVQKGRGWVVPDPSKLRLAATSSCLVWGSDVTAGVSAGSSRGGEGVSPVPRFGIGILDARRRGGDQRWKTRVVEGGNELRGRGDTKTGTAWTYRDYSRKTNRRSRTSTKRSRSKYGAVRS